MSTSLRLDQAALDAAADQLLAAWDGAQLAPAPSSSSPGFDLAAAWQVAERLMQRRQARGEVVVGWKIGFTNRSIWDRYDVHAPIWGPVWQGGLQLLDVPRTVVSLTGLCQPRLEPEIVFGFGAAPRAGMGLDELRGCIAWVAHGFEIVHTHFEGWRFTAPDTVADFALHGRLLVGPRVPAAGWERMAEDLAELRIELLEGAQPRDAGLGRVVLDVGRDFDTAYRFFLEAYPAQGWTVVSSVRGKNSFVVMTRQERTATLEMVDGGMLVASTVSITMAPRNAPVVVPKKP